MFLVVSREHIDILQEQEVWQEHQDQEDSDEVDPQSQRGRICQKKYRDDRVQEVRQLRQQ